MIKFQVRPDGKNDVIATKHDRKRWQDMAREMVMLGGLFSENDDEPNNTAAGRAGRGLRSLLAAFNPEEGDDPTTIGPPPKEEPKEEPKAYAARRGGADAG